MDSTANVRNVEKRLTALERDVRVSSSSKSQVANMSTLGLWAFALTTATLQIRELRVGASDSGAVGVTVGLAFGFGGLAQLLAGILSAFRGNMFAATAFSSYGGFWLSWAVWECLVRSGDVDVVGDKSAEEALLFMWALLTLVLFLCSFNTNVAVSSLFLTLACLFFLLAGAKHSGSAALKLVASLWGVCVSAIAFYAGAGELMNDQYGRTCIPLGEYEHTHTDRSFNEPRSARAPLHALPK